MLVLGAVPCLVLQRACVDIDLSQPKEQDAADEEDDLLAAYLSPPVDTNAKGKAGRAGGGKGGKQRSPSPLLVDGDLAELASTSPADATARPAAGAGRGKAKAAAAAAGDPSPDPVRVAALQQRALQEQLAQATHAAEEEEDEIELLSSDEGESCPRCAGMGCVGAASTPAVLGRCPAGLPVGGSSPAMPQHPTSASASQRALPEPTCSMTGKHAERTQPSARQPPATCTNPAFALPCVAAAADRCCAPAGPALPRPPGLDLTGADDPEDPALLLETLGASQPDPAAAAAAAGGEGDRLPLVFQAQGHDKVTVRVQPHQPLSHGMDIFTKYATDKGWGRVVKFMFDGEKLSGEDTPEDLGIEAEEVIDVYLEA